MRFIHWILDATWHNHLPNQLSNITSPSLTLLQFIPRAQPAVTLCLPFVDISRVESTGSINTTFVNMQLCVFLPYELALHQNLLACKSAHMTVIPWLLDAPWHNQSLKILEFYSMGLRNTKFVSMQLCIPDIYFTGCSNAIMRLSSLWARPPLPSFTFGQTDFLC